MTIPATIATGGHVTDPEIVDAQLAILQLLLAFTNGVLNVANGGSGSATQNFVDLTTTQTAIGGAKTFTTNPIIAITGGNAVLTINAVTASHYAVIDMQQSGTTKWEMGKDPSDTFYLFDASAAARNILSCSTGGAPSLYQEAWTAATYANSWVDFGVNNFSAGYMKDANGFVHLRGTVKNGTAVPTTIFTLPVGYRPAKNALYAVYSAGAFGACAVNADGTVVASVGSTLSFVLDGITFDTR